MNDGIKVYAQPLPFSNKEERAMAAPGSSIKDIVESIVPPQYWPAGITVGAQINGEPIDPQYWHLVRPKMGTIVNVSVVPQGGKGKKSPIASLLSIAVLIAAPYVGAALANVAGFGGLWVGSTFFSSATIYSAAFGAVAKLAISALAPPPKPSKVGQNSISNPAESPTQFIEGARNAMNPYGVVPICLGVNRMFPLQAAKGYTETQDNDQYVRQLFTYGWGTQMVISNLQIGETSLTEFNDFEIEHKLNGDLADGTTLFSNDVFQEDFSILLQQVDGYSVRSTQNNTDEAVVDFTFPRGLAFYNSQGKRQANSVRLEMQYALSGVSPQDWSPAALAYKDFPGGSVGLQAPQLGEGSSMGGLVGYPRDNGTRTDYVVIDKYSGEIYVVKGQYGFTKAQPIDNNAIVLAKAVLTSTRNTNNGTITTNVAFSDERSSSLFGTTFEDSNSFIPSRTGLTVNVSAGALVVDDLYIIGDQSEALRKSIRVKFPTRGKYDIRARRISGDTNSDQSFDKVYLTAIKSVRYEPPTNAPYENGTALRMKGSDQLNGAVDQFNVIAANVIPDFSAGTGTWDLRISSNPAALYRWVLQGPANARPLADDKIDIEFIEEWHTYCEEQGYSYNRVIDFDTSVDEVLRDIAAAGSASPAIVDGKRTVVIDRVTEDIAAIITPRNSWGYSGEMTYPEIPHAFRVQFRNADKGYVQDERIVYADGYDESNATKFELLELQSCTNADLAFKTARRHLASIILRPETHTWMMDVENLAFLRGSRVKLEHDAPIIGIGDGRVKEVFLNTNSPQQVIGFSIDDTVTVPSAGTYYTRIRLSDGTQLYKQVLVTVGEMTSFTFAQPFGLADTPAKGDLCYFVEAGGEVDLVVTKIEPQNDLTARITAVNYAPEVQDAENSAIPPFTSNITTPLEFIRPLPPVLANDQSDEAVMLVNSDGTFTPRAVFTLINQNEGTVNINVKVRKTGTQPFAPANVLESTPERLILTGLEDGQRYDIHIRYSRPGSVQNSLALELNNYLFIGASGLPDDVDNFTINVVDNTALLKWDANDDIDLAFYRLKFSTAESGVTWTTAQLLEDRVYENRLTTAFQQGTYLIKAVDLSGNESENATAIITFTGGTSLNAVETLIEEPAFAGVMDNVQKIGNAIALADPTLSEGYYYFYNDLDLSDVFTSTLSADIQANGTFINDLFSIPDLFAETDLFGAGGNDLFAETDLFALDDMFGIGEGGWDIQLQYRVTNDDPGNSPVIWSDWQEFVAGNVEFRAIQFRLRLRSFTPSVSPLVSVARVNVDMPDRIERGEDLAVPDTGVTITYDTPFKNNPAVVITIQDGDAGDEIQFISKTSGGFTFMVYNTGTAGYVARTFDFISSGYGRNST